VRFRAPLQLLKIILQLQTQLIPASTLGDSTVLAALKAKMEKTEKNNFTISYNKSLTAM
jgi:hypothetical protein